MNRLKLIQDLEWVENKLIFLREGLDQDLWQNQLIADILEVQHDILTELLKMSSKNRRANNDSES